MAAISEQSNGGEARCAVLQWLAEVGEVDAANGQNGNAHRATDCGEAVEAERRAIEPFGRGVVNRAANDEVRAARFSRARFSD